MIVVKVGGSLYDHPKLGPRLKAYLDSLGDVLLVPGGGPFADEIRDRDRRQELGEERSHWLALKAMNQAGAFLTSLGITTAILDAVSFCRTNDTVPHTWDATSDSIAALAATVNRASRLLILKSIDISASTSWTEAAEKGWVDACFPKLAAAATFPIEAVNFRRFLDTRE